MVTSPKPVSNAGHVGFIPHVLKLHRLEDFLGGFNFHRQLRHSKLVGDHSLEEVDHFGSEARRVIPEDRLVGAWEILKCEAVYDVFTISKPFAITAP